LSADEKETAVVLCNETLIEPVLHAIPPLVKEANITKGYPVRHTVAHQVLEKSMEEATDGAKSNVGWLEETMDLLHKMASEQRQGETPLERTLNTEAFFLVYTALNRFRRLISEGWLDLERATLFKLVRQAVAPLSVPFHGEPAAGLQIMGVLETRCLDFKNVIMLSVSEGFLPGTMKDNSFIPYNLRLEFGLTTTRHTQHVRFYNHRLFLRGLYFRNAIVEKQQLAAHILINGRRGKPAHALCPCYRLGNRLWKYLPALEIEVHGMMGNDQW